MSLHILMIELTYTYAYCFINAYWLTKNLQTRIVVQMFIIDFHTLQLYQLFRYKYEFKTSRQRHNWMLSMIIRYNFTLNFVYLICIFHVDLKKTFVTVYPCIEQVHIEK
jgi:hypothetical protein